MNVEPQPAPAYLLVTKTADGEPGTGFTFDATGMSPARFTLDDDGSQEYDELAPGTYVVQEQVSPGWLTRGECSDGTRIRNGMILVDLAPGDDVTCTVRNREPAELIFVKDAEEPTSSRFDFSLTLDGAAIADCRLAASDPGTAPQGAWSRVLHCRRAPTPSPSSHGRAGT